MAVKYLNYEGLEHLSDYIKARLVVVDDIPESPSNGDIILYMGETTADYTRGCLYSYNSEDEEWELESANIKVNLNGEDVSGSVSLYAATQAGEPGKILTSMGENEEPEWRSYTGYAPEIYEDILAFTFGTIPEVENNSLIFDV